MEDKIPHATNAGYTYHGCRCEGCVEAHRVYHRFYARRAAGRTASVIEGPSEIVTAAITIEEADLWTERAVKAGLSRAAFIRRAVNESIEAEQAYERIRARELETPLLDHGG